MDAFDDQLSSSEGGNPEGFTYYFLSDRGNEFFCEIDEDYILDRFNLTGISSEVTNFQLALELLTDTFNHDDIDEERRRLVEADARHLYGLIHARYIVTPRGLTKMASKCIDSDFGRCPRVFCAQQSLLPIGLSDVCHVSSVQLYCPNCEDIYSPKSARHAQIDGAYFGTSFPHLLLSAKPDLSTFKNTERYVPRIFGFRVHGVANIHRRQDELRKRRRIEAPSSPNKMEGLSS